MNNKEETLYQIVDAVVECCATRVGDRMSVTSADVLGTSRAENVVMTRALLACQIAYAGYSTTTAAQLLGRSVQAVRHLYALASNLRETSRAFRIAEAEATIRCKDLGGGI